MSTFLACSNALKTALYVNRPLLSLVFYDAAGKGTSAQILKQRSCPVVEFFGGNIGFFPPFPSFLSELLTFSDESLGATVERMEADTIAIPKAVLSSVETLDELQDWLTAQNPKVMGELLQARKEDLAGEFKPWTPRHLK